MRRRLLLLALCFLAADIPTARGAHRDQWVEVRSPHFTVLSNAGEKGGRHVAAQFEEIRALFKAAFSKLRVDPGKPTIAFALKNEDSLKLLLPSYGLNRNAKRLAGFYRPTNDKNYAVIRVDVTGSGTNAYHALYHEYTHALLRLNYRGLPLWLEEGLAEFYGNSMFDDKQASFGMVDNMQLRLLQQTPLIPIETLMTVDYASPMYNAREHAGIFYAESWALVHYFALAPEVRQQGLLNKFLTTLQATDDAVEAAKQSFGDLGKLTGRIESYARQRSFMYQKMPLQAGISEKEFTVRPLTQAEALAAQGDFLVHNGNPAEALNVLHQAEAEDAKLPAVHEGLGYYHFLNSDYENAEKQFDEALRLAPKDGTAFFYKASILLRKSGYTAETTPKIRENLEQAVELSPDFAPSHALLCMAYTKSPETKAKSTAEALRALELEPGNMAYFINLGRALLVNGKIEDAKRVADRAQRSAISGRDHSLAAAFAKLVVSPTGPSEAKAAGGPSTGDRSAPDEVSGAAAQSEPQTRVVEGQITELICGHPPEALLTVTTSGEQILLHVKDVSKIEIRAAGQPSSSSALPCTQWRDRRVRVAFSLTPGSAGQGEVHVMAFE